MKKRFHSLLLLALLTGFILMSCDEINDTANPGTGPANLETTYPHTGSADFTTLVSIGNSLTAAGQNGAVYYSSQIYSFGNLLAQQVKTNYEQPLISDPGIGEKGRMELVSLNPLQITYNPVMGYPINFNYPYPYNNLGVYGAYIYEIRKNFTTIAGNPFFGLVLRNPAFGNSVLQQAVNLDPTFVTLWIGNNDYIRYALAGGTNMPGWTITDPALFASEFSAIISGLINDTDAKIAVSNLSDAMGAPYFTYVTDQVAAEINKAKLLNPMAALVYQEGDGGIGVAQFNNPREVLLTLRGGSVAQFIGQSFDWWTANGLPVPPGYDVSKPFGLHPQNPWPHPIILDPDEIANVESHLASFNYSIESIAGQYPERIVLVDSYNLFKAYENSGKKGIIINGIKFNMDYVTGNLFSLDGIHLTSRCNGIIANNFIEAINDKFNAKIHKINIQKLPPPF